MTTNSATFNLVKLYLIVKVKLIILVENVFSEKVSQDGRNARGKLLLV